MESGDRTNTYAVAQVCACLNAPACMGKVNEINNDGALPEHIIGGFGYEQRHGRPELKLHSPPCRMVATQRSDSISSKKFHELTSEEPSTFFAPTSRRCNLLSAVCAISRGSVVLLLGFDKVLRYMTAVARKYLKQVCLCMVGLHIPTWEWSK